MKCCIWCSISATLLFMSLLRNYPGPFVLFFNIVWNGWIIASNWCILVSFSPLNALLFHFYLMASCRQGFSCGWCLRNILLLAALLFPWAFDHSSGPFGHDSGGSEFKIGSFIEWHIIRANRRLWMEGFRLAIGQQFRWRRIYSDILLLWYLIWGNFKWCSDSAVLRDQRLGNGSGISAFTVTSFSGETSYAWFIDNAVMAWSCWLDGVISCDLEHAVEFLELIRNKYCCRWRSQG